MKMQKVPYCILVIIILGIIFISGCSPKDAIEGTVFEEEEPEIVEEMPKPEPVEAVKEIKEVKEPASEQVVVEEPKPCGSFFDAYTRITGGPQDSGEVLESELAYLLAKRMQENNVGCALLVGVDVTDFDMQQQIKDSIDYSSAIINSYPGKFVPLLDIDADTVSEITLDLIKGILEEAEGKIDYQGFGEVSFVDPGPWKNKKFTDVPLPELIEFFGERDMVVAAHIARGQAADLKAILTQYPDTKILVHGYPDGIKELLVKHKNLYFAAELEIMLGKGTYSCSISFSDSDVDSAIHQYAPLIAAAPEQVLWATNAHSKCHFQPGFYGKLIEFSKKFVEKLPEEHRDKFAYQNALRVFGERER